MSKDRSLSRVTLNHKLGKNNANNAAVLLVNHQTGLFSIVGDTIAILSET